MLRADPRYGFDQIATFIRQQPGMNYTFITAQFIGEVLSLLQLTEEGSGLASGRSETVSPSPGERHQTSLAAPYTNSGNETVKGVKAPVKPGEAGETLVNIHTSGETGKAPGGVQAHAYAPVAQPSRSVNGDHSERITDPEHAAVSAVNHAPFAPEIAQESGRHGQMNFAQIGADFPMHLPTHSERDLSGNAQTILAANRPRITRKLDAISAPDVAANSAALNHQIETKSEESERANREPYTCTIAEAAERKGCPKKVIEEAIRAGSTRQPQRGDGSKVLISSLDEWTPPRKRRKHS